MATKTVQTIACPPHQKHGPDVAHTLPEHADTKRTTRYTNCTKPTPRLSCQNIGTAPGGIQNKPISNPSTSAESPTLTPHICERTGDPTRNTPKNDADNPHQRPNIPTPPAHASTNEKAVVYEHAPKILMGTMKEGTVNVPEGKDGARKKGVEGNMGARE
jgi:hypothetical protein